MFSCSSSGLVLVQGSGMGRRDRKSELGDDGHDEYEILFGNESVTSLWNYLMAVKRKARSQSWFMPSKKSTPSTAPRKGVDFFAVVICLGS